MMVSRVFLRPHPLPSISLSLYPRNEASPSEGRFTRRHSLSFDKYAGQANNAGLNKMLVGFNNTNAHALCTFAYCAGPGEEPILFEGRTDGDIVPARGPSNFGWDPVFQPKEGGGKTYAEMESAEKNKISHRYRALEKLKDYLSQ